MQAHVQLIIHTQFQWAEGFARIVSGRIAGRGVQYPSYYFFISCSLLIWISQKHIYLIQHRILQVQKKKKTKNKTKKPTRRIIAQSKIAFNTSLHVFLGFQNSMMGTHLRAPSFSHPSCLAAQIHSESLLLSFSVQWCNGTASAVVKKVPIIPAHCCFLCDRCFLDTWAGERSWFRLLISSHERDVVLNGHVSLKRKKEKKNLHITCFLWGCQEIWQWTLWIKATGWKEVVAWQRKLEILFDGFWLMQSFHPRKFDLLFLNAEGKTKTKGEG